jgi:hypothetical protein
VNSNTQVDFRPERLRSRRNVRIAALNLNGSTSSTHGRFNEALRDGVDFGRTQTLSVRARL